MNGVFTPGRDIVVSTVDTMKLDMKERIASSEGDFTVDLTGVEMIDSKGLGLLIAAYNTLEKSGRKFRVTGAGADIVELFRVMRLDRRFSIE
jgi:anti-anti-sigma factor